MSIAAAPHASPSTTLALSASKRRIWAGRIVSTLPVLFMVFDGVIKLLNIEPVREASARLGWVEGVMPTVGLVELVCTLLYVVPRTSFVGAVLLSGFLGGAVATHVRLGDPYWFPFLVGAFFWGGLYLRSARLRALVHEAVDFGGEQEEDVA